MNHFDFTFVYEHHSSFEPGEVIFKTGDLGDAMYILLEGEVLIKVDDHVIDHLKDGAVFGEMALIDAQTRSASAYAHTPCKLMKIDEDRFIELASQLPKFALAVMRIMSTRTRRLMREEISRQRLVEEIAIGREIQRGLLPESVPTFPGWEFSAVYKTAKEVGGDLYDFILEEDKPDFVEFAVADVTGKGVPAALFMASMRSILRTLAQHSDSPPYILQKANHSILEDMNAPLFLSCLFGRLNLVTGDIQLANAGHDWPIWVKSATQEVETIELPGFVLGMFKKIEPEETEFQIQPGDSLVIFTDGVTEARNEAGEFFDDERLLDTLKANTHKSAGEISQSIVNAVDRFTNGHPRTDDLTLVVIKRLPLDNG